jgi:hypothetical protein
MKSEIVKVLVQIAPKGSPAAAVVYGKDKKNMCEQPLDANVRTALRGALKGYFLADFVDGRWKIGRRVANQRW